VKTSTAAYWLGLPIPVLLFIADLTARNVYFVPVKEAIRRDYDKLVSQETISFTVNESLSLYTRSGLKLLRRLYARERLHEQFSFHITNLISQVDAFADFIRMNQNRDVFMEVQTQQHLQFRAFYESCRMASLYLEDEWKVESLRRLYQKDQDEWQNEYVHLHEKTLDFAPQKSRGFFRR